MWSAVYVCGQLYAYVVRDGDICFMSVGSSEDSPRPSSGQVFCHRARFTTLVLLYILKQDLTKLPRVSLNSLFCPNKL